MVDLVCRLVHSGTAHFVMLVVPYICVLLLGIIPMCLDTVFLLFHVYSVNPEIDVCQAEGAFMFGVGYYTSEKLIFNPETGQLLTHNTWEYKPPASKVSLRMQFVSINTHFRLSCNKSDVLSSVRVEHKFIVILFKQTLQLN